MTHLDTVSMTAAITAPTAAVVSLLLLSSLLPLVLLPLLVLALY
jgi:hypothetical protein